MGKIRHLALSIVLSLLLASMLFSCSNPEKKREQDYLNKAFIEQLGFDTEKELDVFFTRSVNIDEIRLLALSPAAVNPLIYALQRQSYANASKLIEKKARVTYVDVNGNNALMWAIYQEYWDIAKVLVERGSDVNIVNKIRDNPLLETGNAPLDYAARRGASFDFFSLLFSHGAKITKYTFKYAWYNDCSYPVIKLLLEKTIQAGYPLDIHPYTQAVILNDMKAVGEFLENHDAINEKEKTLIASSIPQMAGLGYVDMLRLVKSHGVNINVVSDETPYSRIRESPLQIACMNGQVETAAYLLEEGADANYRDEGAESSWGNDNSVFHLGIKGALPLQYAIWRNDKELVTLLVSHGAVPVEKLNSYKSEKDVLEFAARYADVDMMKHLLSLGFSFDPENKSVTDKIIRNPNCIPILELLMDNGFKIKETEKDLLVMATYSFTDFAVFKWLLDHGANPKRFGDEWENPVCHALKYGSFEKLAYLVKHGGVVNTLTLFEAVWDKNMEGLALLADTTGIDLNATREGSNLLHVAAAEGDERIIQFLVSRGLDINGCDDTGDTPLIIACKESAMYAVRELLRNNADTGIRNKEGKTALEIAKEENYLPILDCFR